MVTNRRRKSMKMRGHHTHGWGSKKKHRGSGNRGGRGMSGTGKRANSIQPLMRKLGITLGKCGFRFKGYHEEISPINFDTINACLEHWVTSKKADKKGDVYHIDLEALGFNKLLGSGQPKAKMEIKVKHCSTGAAEKLSAVGGKVSVTKAEKKEKKEE
ncbi:uL15 family ribosomal protein [Candidatus Woesearchaeota archaeon]|nr:uL15 family ribosomal protein [Candidatus Woesearchaeota archaeon]